MSDKRQPPRFVYKFRSLRTTNDIKRCRDFIVENKIKYSSPDKFNDPFECHVKYRLPKGQKQIDRNVNRIAMMQNMNPQDVRQKMKTEGFTDEIEAIFTKNAAAKLLFYSVSSTYQDPAMWAYYADDHKGVCVELKNDVMYQDPEEVKYPEKPPVITYDAGIYKMKNMYKSLYSKSKSWRHEKEWRYRGDLNMLDQTDGIDILPGNMIVSVILGLHIEIWKREMIEHWLKARTQPASLWTARKSIDKYEIERDEAIIADGRIRGRRRNPGRPSR